MLNQGLEASNVPAKTKMTQAQKFWDGLNEITGSDTFKRFNQTKLPVANEIYTLFASVSRLEPELAAKSAIHIAKSRISLSPGSFRFMIGLFRVVPKNQEIELFSAMVNHKFFEHPENLFELKDHSHWIKTPKIRTSVNKIKNEATGDLIINDNLTKADGAKKQKSIDNLAKEEIKRLRQEVALLTNKPKRVSPRTNATRATKSPALVTREAI